MVFIAQAINPEDAHNNFDSNNGTNIPEMPEAGGGGAYVESINHLSPSQRQTYDTLVVVESGLIVFAILAFVVIVSIRSKMVRRVRHGSR